ncbi:MAG: hypothetical protein DU429_02560 [Candidatus Tokpelaia sp.]|nr:MAG: hypothetical protein DU430_05310 [Candidatus Tokpelaia sp.]KAA6207362.1 MAG: hypothetical protein DU429_02560 [Candidatus Tokpelaia sp.]
MKFETYKLDNEDCAYMQDGMKYLQAGDVFFIPIVRDKNKTHTLYNSAEFSSGYNDLKGKLYLYLVCQYRILPNDLANRKKEPLCFVIPRRKIPPPLRMEWLDRD